MDRKSKDHKPEQAGAGLMLAATRRAAARSLFPIPYSLFPVPRSPFSVAHSSMKRKDAGS